MVTGVQARDDGSSDSKGTVREVDRCGVTLDGVMNRHGMSWMKEGEEARIKRIPSFLVE